MKQSNEEDAMTERKYSSFKWQQQSPRPPVAPESIVGEGHTSGKERAFVMEKKSVSSKKQSKCVSAQTQKDAS